MTVSIAAGVAVEPHVLVRMHRKEANASMPRPPAGIESSGVFEPEAVKVSGDCDVLFRPSLTGIHAAEPAGCHCHA